MLLEMAPRLVCIVLAFSGSSIFYWEKNVNAISPDKNLFFRIWDYLTTLSTESKKTTIIITTHYIEEAKQVSHLIS
jgi:hypothetical protein